MMINHYTTYNIVSGFHFVNFGVEKYADMSVLLWGFIQFLQLWALIN